MDIAFALQEERGAVRAIWLAAFPEDTPASADFFLDRLFRPGWCLVGRLEGKPVTMAFLLPAAYHVNGKALPLQYIYAAATLPAYRGRGLFGTLLRRALAIGREKGDAASFLRPAEPGLARYYERFGYRPYFLQAEIRQGRGTFLLSAGGVSSARGEQEGFAVRRAPGEAARWRDACLSSRGGWVCWPDELAEMAAEAARFAGGNVIAGEGGYTLCEPVGDTLFLREWLCVPEREAALRRAVADHFPQETFLLRRPVALGEGMDAGGRREAFGWLCPLDRTFPSPDLTGAPPYMGLAFD